MSPETLLEQYGYYAVFLGTFLEGETILVLAGFLAERRYLHLPTVILVAFAGAFSGHVFWFWVGRTKGLQTLKRFPKVERHFAKGIRLFERYGAPTIFISQYLYGLRISCAIIVGISKISTFKFLLYQGISCITWAALIGTLGYYFGEAVETVLGKAAHVERYGLMILLLVAFGMWLYHRQKQKEDSEIES
ncbi:MAG: DedA family protein [Acidobacteriota bacterium]